MRRIVLLFVIVAVLTDVIFASKEKTHPQLVYYEDAFQDEVILSAPLPSEQEDEEIQYVVKYKQNSQEFQTRLSIANENTLDNGNRRIRHLGRRVIGSSDMDDMNHHVTIEANAENFLEKDMIEIIQTLSKEEAATWETHQDVLYVERDTKVHPFQNEPSDEQGTPYGIIKTQAILVPDDHIANRKVCMIDSGYDINHPDLPSQATGAVITGTGYGGANGEWDIDTNGHGTHVAGTIVALDNEEGVVGVVRNGKMPMHIVRIFDSTGWAWKSTLVKAVEICVEEGANVVNMSLGGTSSSKFEADAFKRIYEQDNVLLIAAAGNSGNSAKSYPASYESVMSVGSVDGDDEKSSFSQFNNEVDIVAYGNGIKSTIPDGQYASFKGTSMSSPLVAGIAALIWSHNPTKSAKEIWNALISSAKDVGDEGRDNFYGHGIVQAYEAALLVGYEPVCTDIPNFHDSDGEDFNCAWYAADSNCEKYGESFSSNGLTASEACCSCGGGQNTKPSAPSSQVTKSSSPSQAPSKFLEPKCVDFPQAWHDAWGAEFDCLWYSQKESRCRKYGHLFEFDNHVANEACCACGGGQTTSINENDNDVVPSPSFSPSQAPSAISSHEPSVSMLPSSSPSLPSDKPTNPPSKRKSEGPSNIPSLTPTETTSENPSVSNQPTLPTTMESTSSPTTSPSGECVDDPNWFDSDGESYDCNWYSEGLNCKLYGDDETYSNFGMTAKEACCSSCSDSSQCKDVENWFDSGGPRFSCEWYSRNVLRCLKYGDKYENKGFTANQACCSCGGGQ